MAMFTRSLPGDGRFTDPDLSGGQAATSTRAATRVPVNAIALALFVVACGAVALVGASYADTGPGSWYAALEKPGFMPPSWVFPVAVGGSAAIAAFTGWRVWRRAGPEPDRHVALTVFAVQLVLVGAWAPVFFGAQSPEAAMVVLAALWLAVLAMVLTFAPVDPWSSVLVLPYFGWISYAAVLNAAIMLLK